MSRILGILILVLVVIGLIACTSAAAAQRNGNGIKAPAAQSSVGNDVTPPQASETNAPSMPQETGRSLPVPQTEKAVQASLQNEATLPSFSGEIPALVKDAAKGFYHESRLAVPNEKVRERWIKFLEAQTSPDVPLIALRVNTANSGSITYLGYQDGVVETQVCFSVPCDLAGFARVRLFLKERESKKGIPMIPEVVDFKVLQVKKNY